MKFELVAKCVLGAAIAASALTGCTTHVSVSAPAARPIPADPKAALLASTAGVQAGDYAVKIDLQGNRITDSTHWPSRSASYDYRPAKPSASDRPTQIIVVGSQAYQKAKLDMPGGLPGVDDPEIKTMQEDLDAYRAMYDGKHWVHQPQGWPVPFDTAKPDMFGIAQELQRVETVTASSATAFTGTMKPAPGDKKDVPFTATLDDQGRLLTLAEEGTFSLSGYGEQQPKSKPAGALEVPASLQRLGK